MELLWAVIYFTLAALAHTFLTRLVRYGSSIAKFFVAGSLLGLVLTVHLYLTAPSLIRTAAGIATYALACELYLFLFTLVASSVSVQLLIALHSSPLTCEQAIALGDGKRLVAERLHRLSTSGLLFDDYGTWRLSAQAQRLVRLHATFMRFFLPTSAGHPTASEKSGDTPPRQSLDTLSKAW
jgi:hypothetical protein